VLLGTAAYMAPEQARGEPAESASDVFSLGIVLYQLVTGRHPFEADSALGMLHAIVTRPPVPPSRLNAEISAPLEGLLGAMLHKDARLRPSAAEVAASLAALAESKTGRPAREAAPRPIVRRQPELAALRAALAEADAGRARVVCVAGEPGIGKTTLVEDFLDELAVPGPSCLVSRGRCSERLAGTEAYLPVLEALSELLRADSSGSVARLLKVVAPAWYAQVAVDAGPSRALSQQAMLREFTTFLQETSRLGPVVVFFDDIHWADLSTVDLLAHLGRHCRGLRALVVVTYRPTELLLGPHAFHRVRLELQGQGVCTELALGFLGRPDLDRYLALAFPGHALPADFVDLVYSRTEGSPLFLTDLLRYLRERGVIAESGGRWVLGHPLPDLRHELPESVRGMIQRTLGRLGEADRRLLAAASVQGHEFDSAAVAGALRLDAADVEERLQVLDRVHSLVRLVREYEMPDRVLTLRYAFVHVLYQQALYADLQPTRRAALSLAVAETLQSHHGEGNQTVAAELACLFEVGRDFGRAAWQFWLAAQNAARVFAHREAVALARRGLRLLATVPETPGRAGLELPLQTMLGLQLQVTEGYAAAAAHQAYSRARELCPQAPDSAPPFSVLWGLWLFHKVRSELAKAQELAGELLALAGALGDPSLALQAHQALGLTALCRGEPAVALRHVEQAATLYDPVRHRTHDFLFGQDPGVICKAYGAVALWLLGYPDTAQRQSDAAIAMSRGLSPSSQAVALHFAAMLHQLRRDGPRTGACAGSSVEVAAEHGLSFWLAGGTVMAGWARAACGAVGDGVACLRRGLADCQATGSVTYRTYYLGLLAEGLGWHGRADEGVRVLDEALTLVRQTGEGLCAAELHRLRGELLLRGADGVPRAEEDFRLALDIARRSGARSLELRAAMSLVRLGQRLGEPEEGRKLLAETFGWFTEGFQSPDLEEARRLLEPKS
jgi:predicted ATPase